MSSSINREIPFSQLQRPLTAHEEDGTLSREIGLLGQRSHQASRRDMEALTPASVRYVYIDPVVRPNSLHVNPSNGRRIQCPSEASRPYPMRA